MRVGGRIFATLAAEKQGYGNLMLTRSSRRHSWRNWVFLPIYGGWGRKGATHIRLAVVSEDVLEGALRTAWKLRVERNAKAGKKTRAQRRAVPKPNGRKKR